MADAFVSLVSIQPTGSVVQSKGGDKARQKHPQETGIDKYGLFPARRKQAVDKS